METIFDIGELGKHGVSISKREQFEYQGKMFLYSGQCFEFDSTQYQAVYDLLHGQDDKTLGIINLLWHPEQTQIDLEAIAEMDLEVK
ncbi:MAG: hypothetical protein FWF59_08090 [Turicibacter sp.]|nr:hypothetical protein [Turicibacter sp.]